MLQTSQRCASLSRPPLSLFHKPLLVPAPHLLDPIFPLARRRTRSRVFLVHQGDRASWTRIPRGQQPARIVLFDPPRNIPRDAGIQTAVRAAEDVNDPGW